MVNSAEIPVGSRQESNPKCPHCHSALDVIYTSTQVHIYWDYENGRWYQGETNHDTTYQCCHCYEEISIDELDQLEVPNEIR